MGKRKNMSDYRPRKRRFRGNQHEAVINEDGTSSTAKDASFTHEVCTSPCSRPPPAPQPSPSTSSSTKLQNVESECNLAGDSEITGFRFVDSELLVKFVSSLLCPNCKQPIGRNKRLSCVSEKRISLASVFTFECSCKQTVSMDTSKRVGKVYEVNRRFPLAVYSIGRHYTHGKKFLGNMNMPPPPHKNSWALHTKQLVKATENVAERSKRKAAEEARSAADSSDITVSCDGTWQRRGFSSKNGVVTVMTVNGPSSKVIDTQVLSNHCTSCAQQKKKIHEADFAEWKRKHSDSCEKNHEGSAGSMEPAGAQHIFRQSIKKYGLQYTSYLGDGDSKSYSSLKNADPPIYPGKNIKKLECCGHVQKRMGRQLTNKVNELKKETYEHNGKTVRGIGGKGGLTKKAILRIQGHFGAAVRNNVQNVQQMKKDIWAIWEHRTKKHDNCGVWCPSKSGKGDPNRNALPKFVCDAIRPVFETLSDHTLLERCSHGGSQNTNESFHNLIWQHCPKASFVGRTRLSLAVAEAAIVYNDGQMGRLDVFRELGFTPGHYTELCLQQLDKARIEGSKLQSLTVTKQARKSRALREADSQEESENFYQSGAHE